MSGELHKNVEGMTYKKKEIKHTSIVYQFYLLGMVQVHCVQLS